MSRATAGRPLQITVPQLCVELNDIGGLLAARAALPGGAHDAARIGASMAASFSAKVALLRTFDAQNAMRLCEVLGASTLTPDLKTIIQAAIDARLERDSSGVVPIAGTKGLTQDMLTPLTYGTSTFWARMEDNTVSYQSKVQLVIDLFNGKLGVIAPSEQTIKRLVACLLSCHFNLHTQFPSYQSIYDMVVDFKRTLDASRKPFPFGIVHQYPPDPAGLSTQHWNHAYDDADPPIVKTFERYDALLGHIPLRSNSALIMKERSQRGAQTGGSLRCNLQDGATNPMAMFQAMMEQMQEQQQNGRRGRYSGSHEFQTRTGGGEQPNTSAGARFQHALEDRKRTQHELQDGDPSGDHAPDQPGSHDQGANPNANGRSRMSNDAASFKPPWRRSTQTPFGEADDDAADHDHDGSGTDRAGNTTTDEPTKHAKPGKGAEAFEDAAFEALLARNAKKAASSKAVGRPKGGTAKGGVTKKPAMAAASSKPQPTKPATNAHLTKIAQDSLALWVPADKKKPEKNFTSKTHHWARSEAARWGGDEADCKHAASLAYAAGKALYIAKTKK